METHYRESVNGQFEDCTKEVPPGEEIESSSEEDDLDMTRNSTKCDFVNASVVINSLFPWLLT